jgi:catechol 2,3-dioxygenase-like lactoylglutathione lyase family enzyme
VIDDRRLQEQAPAFRFDHAALSVPDLEAAIGWYGKMLGFRVSRRFALAPAKAECAIMARGNMRIELFQPVDAVSAPDERRDPITDIKLLGIKHVAFQTDDFVALVDWLEANDADIAKVVTDSFGQAIFVRDIAGNLVEFVSRSATPGDET